MSKTTAIANYCTGYKNAREAWLTYLADNDYMSEPYWDIVEENPNLKEAWNIIQDAYFPYGLDEDSIANQRHYATLDDFHTHEWDSIFDDPEWLEVGRKTGQ